MGLFGKLIGNLPSTSPPPGSVTLADLAPLAAFSQIANETASSATPTAVKMMGIPGQTSAATAAGTTTLTNLSKGQQIFTGATTQTVVLPVVSTLPVLGFGYWIINNSSGALTVNSSGANLVLTIAAGARALVFCKLLTGTSAVSWDYISFASGITNSAPANTVTKSDGTNLVASQITDDGTDVAINTSSGLVTITADQNVDVVTGGEFTVNGNAPLFNGANVAIGTGLNNIQIIGASVVGIFGTQLLISSTADTSANPTINTPLGIVRIAAASATVTVTSANVTANSIIFGIPRRSDTTLKSVSCNPGSGSFVVTGNAAAASNTDISIFILNPA